MVKQLCAKTMEQIEEGNVTAETIAVRLKAKIGDDPAKTLALAGGLISEARDRMGDLYESAKGADELMRQANMALDVVIVLCGGGKKMGAGLRP